MRYQRLAVLCRRKTSTFHRNCPPTRSLGSALFGLTKTLGGIRDTLSRKARQFAKWDCLRSVLCYLEKAFFAHKYTITSFLPPLLYGYAGDCIPAFYWDGYNRFATSCTHDSKLRVCLPISSSPISSSRKLHSDSPPSGWRKFAIDDYWYYVNGEWAGIVITTKSRLWVSWEKIIYLKHPSYSIIFCPSADTNNICHLIERPTLSEAKKLAEEYYKQWLSVNQQRAEPLVGAVRP